ncbi:C40 family peptidase [Mumia xiangluensis]|uniref:C40 family peptidase n=1 Tax=Mumia xiangluensis TaxID=1678900 RepID=A0ABW1QRJ0_9ACTN
MRLGRHGEAGALRRALVPLLAAGTLTFTGVGAAYADPAPTDDIPSAEDVAQAQTNAAAKADDVVSIRARITAATARVDTLAAQAAAASEKYNGAEYALAQAEKALAAAKADAEAAATAAEAEPRLVERLTLGGVAVRDPYHRLRSFFYEDGPTSILNDIAAYDAVGDASRAALARYESKRAVAASLQRAAEVAVAKQEKATASAKAAKQEAETAVAAAAAARASLQRDRDQLIRELAHAEGISVTIARKRQRALEKLAQAAQESANRPPEDLSQIAPTPTPAPSPAPGPAPAPSPSPTPVDPNPPKRVKGVEAAIRFAMEQVGEPYVWAGAGPDVWDCSGLTMRAWGAAGKALPHFSGAQYASSVPISLADAKRGDLLFWSRGGPSSIYHVALYLGDGWMIEAPRPGKNVQVVSVYASTTPDLAARIR